MTRSVNSRQSQFTAQAYIVPKAYRESRREYILHTRRGRSYFPVPLLRRADHIRPYGPLVQGARSLAFSSEEKVAKRQRAG